jgi:RNA polymerase sigma-70 factor, ECF subfamily
VQEAFARASVRWSWLRDYNAPEAWVRRVAMNLAADRARKLRRQARAILQLGLPPGAPEVSVETLALVEALRTLPVRQRQAIVLHHLVGLPVEEVAQTLRIPAGTVKSLLSHGRWALAARLGEPEEALYPAMNDLQTRLQKAADEAARHGRTPGPEAAIGRGRQRRRRLAGATATVLALLLLAITVGADQLGGGNQLAPLAPPSTARPPAKAPQPGGPPDLSDVQLPAGSPPGRVGKQMVWDVTRELARCQRGDTAGPKVLVAWGAAHGRTWLIAAEPPQAGQTWLCWANGVFDAGGAGGYGKEGGPGFPLKPLQASGVQNIRSHGKYWGPVMGYVTKRATRVQVLFRSGIAHWSWSRSRPAAVSRSTSTSASTANPTRAPTWVVRYPGDRLQQRRPQGRRMPGHRRTRAQLLNHRRADLRRRSSRPTDALPQAPTVQGPTP